MGEQTAQVLHTEQQNLAAVGFSSHALCNAKKGEISPASAPLRSPDEQFFFLSTGIAH